MSTSVNIVKIIVFFINSLDGMSSVVQSSYLVLKMKPDI